MENKHNYFCSKCKDQVGYIVIEDGVEYWKQCECIERRKVQRLMKSSAITEGFQRLGFSNFRTEEKDEVIVDAYQCALSYYNSFKSIEEMKQERKNSIALLGQPGAGKTHLLTAIANNLIQKKHLHVIYFPFVEGFNDLKDDFDQLEEKLTRMKSADVLFIDDLFKPVSVNDKYGRRKVPKATEWQIEQMYAVINHRYLNHLPILISSELDIDEMVAVDEALATRILEMCKDYLVVIHGDPMKLNHRLEGVV